MASSNLLPNLYADRMFVNRLRTIHLKANEIQSNDIIDLDEDEELKKLLSVYVKLLVDPNNNDYKLNATNNLLQPALMKSTMNMANGFVNGIYWPVGLHNLLTQQVLSFSGTECPVIHLVEYVIQGLATLDSFPDESSGITYTFTSINPSFNMYNENLLELFNIIELVLEAERQMGVKYTGFRQHSNYSGNTLTVGLDLFVKSQLINEGGSFLVTKATLDNYCLPTGTNYTQSKLTYDTAKYQSLTTKVHSLAQLIDSESEMTVTVTASDGTTVGTYPVLGNLLEWLFIGHSATANIGYELQNTSLPVPDSTPSSFGKWNSQDPTSLPHTDNLEQIGLAFLGTTDKNDYYFVPALEDFANYTYDPNNNIFSFLLAFIGACNTSATKKLDEMGVRTASYVKKPDINGVASGYTVTIPTTSDAYKIYHVGNIKNHN